MSEKHLNIIQDFGAIFYSTLSGLYFVVFDDHRFHRRLLIFNSCGVVCKYRTITMVQRNTGLKLQEFRYLISKKSRRDLILIAIDVICGIQNNILKTLKVFNDYTK